MVAVDPEIATANSLSEPGGVLIVEVLPGGPSDGVLQPSVETTDSPQESETDQDNEDTPDDESLPTGGDVIIELNGTPIPDTDALSRTLALETSPGETVPVTVIRDDEEVTVDVTLGSRPTE
jgi:S1-C subfamily serine protease